MFICCMAFFSALILFLFWLFTEVKYHLLGHAAVHWPYSWGSTCCRWIFRICTISFEGFSRKGFFEKKCRKGFQKFSVWVKSSGVDSKFHQLSSNLGKHAHTFPESHLASAAAAPSSSSNTHTYNCIIFMMQLLDSTIYTLYCLETRSKKWNQLALRELSVKIHIRFKTTWFFSQLPQRGAWFSAGSCWC